MVAFVASLIVMALSVALVVWYGRRRDPATPLTWGEAFVAGTFVFFMLFWAYGVVPHQWLTWADNELNWRADELLIGPGSTTADTWFPFTVTKSTVRDVIATLIYVAFLGGQIWGWMWWQQRGEKKAPEVAPSPYGRPLVKPEGEG